MPTRAKGKKRGPKEGVTKALARQLDPDFPDRLRQAMGRRQWIRDNGNTMNAELARHAHCTHAVIGQYLGGKKRSMDPHLLLDLCDALSLSPYWLLKNEGTIDDVPLNALPFETARKQTRKKIETHSERTRSTRHVA